MDHASGISTEYYKVFYYVGRLGSITAAAEALCISQPAASQAIKQLEKALNTKLFLRTQKGVRLTTEGKLLYPYVERGMENLMDGEEMLKRLVDMDMGEVRIGASDMTLQFYLLPYLETFMSAIRISRSWCQMRRHRRPSSPCTRERSISVW